MFFQKQIPVKSNKDSDKAIIFASKSIYNHDETLKVLGFCSISGKSFPGHRTKRLKKLDNRRPIHLATNHGPGDLGQRKMGSLQDGTLGR